MSSEACHVGQVWLWLNMGEWAYLRVRLFQQLFHGISALNTGSFYNQVRNDVSNNQTPRLSPAPLFYVSEYSTRVLWVDNNVSSELYLTLQTLCPRIIWRSFFLFSSSSQRHLSSFKIWGSSTSTLGQLKQAEIAWMGYSRRRSPGTRDCFGGPTTRQLVPYLRGLSWSRGRLLMSLCVRGNNLVWLSLEDGSLVNQW